MNKMTTLTIGDKTWQVWDPEAARIDDTKVGDTAWSSQKLVEMLCPERTAKGKQIDFLPVEGTPLLLTTQIQPIQDGSGATSYENIRPITGFSGIQLQLQNGSSGQTYTAEFTKPAYFGAFDWSAGRLTLTHSLLTLSGEESGWVIYSTHKVLNHSLLRDAKRGNTLIGLCSHAPTRADGFLDYSIVLKTNATGGLEIATAGFGLPDNAVENWKNYLKQQAAAGTPVQILYMLEQPEIIDLTPVEITAISGLNTLTCEAGESEVTYRADPRKLLENLA